MDAPKQNFVSIGIALLLFSCELDQIPDEITFETTFGGTAIDGGYSVQQTSDGGYIIAGYTESIGNGARDVYLIKTNVNGESGDTNGLFELPFGTTADEEGRSVRQTQDGGYIITGYTSEFTDKGKNVYLFKTVSNGNIESYPRNFGGDDDDEGRSVHLTQDGGYVITGYTEIAGKGKNVYLIKTGADMFSDFKRDYGEESNNEGKSVQQTEDQGYIITGYSYDAENLTSSVWLMKTDANGMKDDTDVEKAFDKYFGNSAENIGYSVQQTLDGGYIVVGSTIKKGRDVYLIKTDAKGSTIKTNDNIVFERTYGGDADDVGYSVQQTQDGGYIIVGYTESYGNGGKDVYLIKTNAHGDIVNTTGDKGFETHFGGTAMDEGYSVQQTQDGGYIITGYTESYGQGAGDVYLIKTNADGEVVH